MERDAASLPVPGTRAAPYRVEMLLGADELRPLLRVRPAYTAYTLGQLDPRYVAGLRAWRAEGLRGQALVVYSRGSLGEAMLVSGDPTALEAALRLHPGPRVNYATALPEHRDVLRRHYIISHPQPMLRMRVSRNSFRPLPDEGVERLLGADVRELNRLYASEGGAAFYRPAHVAEGVYVGIRGADRRLVAAAGTHVWSAAERVGVVGNVFTHPHHRGQGLAKTCTSAVTATLLEHCDTVVLTVEPGNTPAVHAYRRLGYEDDGLVLESAVMRRDLVGLGHGLRRAWAHVRGHSLHREVVWLRPLPAAT